MNIPTALLESLQDIPDYDASSFMKAHELQASISIKTNPNKPFDIQEENIPIAQNIPWNTHGFSLSSKINFTHQPPLHAGAFYVQEASSQFLSFILNQIQQENKFKSVLDLCAAPGGKSTLLLANMAADSLLVSNEVIRSRVNVLQENLIKWGNDNVLISNNDAEDFQNLSNFFDAVIIDAPCSGSGLFRKDKESIQQWSSANVALCEKRQQRIIKQIMPCVAINGYLIYSTCSYSTCENEDMIDYILSHPEYESVSLNIPADFKITTTFSKRANGVGYRFWPHKLIGEGFFISIFKKTKNVETNISNNNKNSKNLAPINYIEVPSYLQQYFQEPNNFLLFENKENTYAIRKSLAADISSLRKELNVVKWATKIGKIINQELIPDHEFALSSIINKNINCVALDLNQAIKYLKCETIELPQISHGWHIVQYKGLNLGWIKAMPNRIKNHYPINYRILK